MTQFPAEEQEGSQREILFSCYTRQDKIKRKGEADIDKLKRWIVGGQRLNIG